MESNLQNLEPSSQIVDQSEENLLVNSDPHSQLVDQSQEHLLVNYYPASQLANQNEQHIILNQAPFQSQPQQSLEEATTKQVTESQLKNQDNFKPQSNLSPDHSNHSTETPMQIEKPHSQDNLSALQKNKKAFTNEKDRILCDMDEYFNGKLYGRLPSNFFNIHSIISAKDEDRNKFSQIFSQMNDNDRKIFQAEKLGLSQKQSRGIAAVLGMAIGDALGASTQFQYFRKQGLGIIKNGFKDIHQGIMQGKIRPRSNKVSVWTDDASMGLCMADSLLLNDYEFNPTHMRYMFIVWLQNGLNNGGRSHSIGLGGNISISMNQFMHHQEKYTDIGERFNNGNGSLMRLAPVPVAYSDNLTQGVQNSGLQSLTTHNGLEAQQCSKLMATIIIKLINRDKQVNGKDLILKICDGFKSPAKSVEYLARGKQQSTQLYEQSCKLYKQFKKFNKSITDRNWNWRDQNHTYSPCRTKQQPGYIGSYCMDALSMALHTVLFSNSFKEVVTKNADMGGDCDTVGSIAGQIAGALYGVNNQMLELYSEMQDFTSTRYDVFLKAYKLINKKKLQVK